MKCEMWKSTKVGNLWPKLNLLKYWELWHVSKYGGKLNCLMLYLGEVGLIWKCLLNRAYKYTTKNQNKLLENVLWTIFLIIILLLPILIDWINFLLYIIVGNKCRFFLTLNFQLKYVDRWSSSSHTLHKFTTNTMGNDGGIDGIQEIIEINLLK